MSQKQVPRLFFVGAGNIAQSLMKGIIRARPGSFQQMMATAPTTRNLDIVKNTLGCETTLLVDAINSFNEFKPDFVFLCIKPQVLKDSISDIEGALFQLLTSISNRCTVLSLLAGIKHQRYHSAFGVPHDKCVRVMLNTAAEIGSTSVLYHTQKDFDSAQVQELEALFRLIGRAVVRLDNEDLMDVATGVCGSGIAFFYEVIQTISDIGVKNGLSRNDATLIAAQLSKAAGEMLLAKQTHPYQLRDDVTSPSGTTIYGLSKWHEQATGQSIGQAFQAAIDRSKELSTMSEAEFPKR